MIIYLMHKAMEFGRFKLYLIGALSGFYLGFLFWGKALKVIVDGSCSHRRQFSLRGVWGNAPPEIFATLSLLRVVLRHSETVLRS